MSIALMSRVWKTSEQKGSGLLLLLAIADYANDKNEAYPSIDSLAAKTRLSRRNVQILTGQIQKAGELEIDLNAGPHGTNIYRIIQKGGANFAPVQKPSGGVQTGDTGLHPIRQEPSATEAPTIRGPKVKAMKAGRPTNPHAVRVAACVGRKATTEWGEPEVKLFKQVAKRGDFENELSMMERYYGKMRKKPDNHCRTNLERLLKFWSGEVDRAQGWCEKNPLPGARKIKAPAVEPELPSEPLPDPNEPGHRKIIEDFERKFKRLPTGYARNVAGDLIRSNGAHNLSEGP